MPDIREHVDHLLQLITEALPMEAGGDESELLAWDEGNQCALSAYEGAGRLGGDGPRDSTFVSWTRPS